MAVHEQIIKLHAQLYHAATGCAIDNNIVEGKAAKEHLALTEHAAFKHGALLCDIITSQYAPKGILGLFDGDIRNEAKPSVIDTDQGDIVISQGPGSAQHGAVTTHHNGQIALLTHLLIAAGGNAGHRHALRCLLLDEDRTAGTDEHGGDGLEMVFQAAILITTD